MTNVRRIRRQNQCNDSEVGRNMLLQRITACNLTQSIIRFRMAIRNGITHAITKRLVPTVLNLCRLIISVSVKTLHNVRDNRSSTNAGNITTCRILQDKSGMDTRLISARINNIGISIRIIRSFAFNVTRIILGLNRRHRNDHCKRILRIMLLPILTR